MIDNSYPVTANNSVQANEPRDHVTLDQSPHCIEANEDDPLILTAPVHTNQNRFTASGLYSANQEQVTESIQINSNSSKYRNILISWSIVNTLCCIWPLGIVALVISIITLKTPRNGNEQSRSGAITAVIINTLSTIGGIVGIIFVVVHIDQSKPYNPYIPY